MFKSFKNKLIIREILEKFWKFKEFCKNFDEILGKFLRNENFSENVKYIWGSFESKVLFSYTHTVLYELKWSLKEG